VISHSDWNDRQKRGSDYVQDHRCDRSGKIRLDAKGHKGNLRLRFSRRKETEAGCYPIAITGRSQDSNSPVESKTLDNRSEEEAELVCVDPQHPERAFRIGAKLPANEKTRFKKFLSENLDVFA